MSVMPSHAAPGEASDVVPEALEQLLAQIRRYPLLSPADEVRLAKRVERGDREARTGSSRRTSAWSSTSPDGFGVAAFSSSISSRKARSGSSAP